MFLEKEIFRCIVKNTPLISIDFIIKYNNKYLLGRRLNLPGKGFFFTIGGRILKNEAIKNARKRILKEELNIENVSENNFKFIGIFEHFYKDSIFGKNISTHYINIGYELKFDKIANNFPKIQHDQYVWLSKEEILKREDVHFYVKEYFKGSKYV